MKSPEPMPEDAASTSRGVRCGSTIIDMALLASDGRVRTLLRKNAVECLFQIMQRGGIIACIRILKFVMIEGKEHFDKAL